MNFFSIALKALRWTITFQLGMFILALFTMQWIFQMLFSPIGFIVSYLLLFSLISMHVMDKELAVAKAGDA